MHASATPTYVLFSLFSFILLTVIFKYTTTTTRCREKNGCEMRIKGAFAPPYCSRPLKNVLVYGAESGTLGSRSRISEHLKIC